MAGADPAEISTISDSFLDWVDIDENPHLSGTRKPGLHLPSQSRIRSLCGEERANR